MWWELIVGVLLKCRILLFAMLDFDKPPDWYLHL